MKNDTAGPLVKILKRNCWRFVHQKQKSLVHTPWTAIAELRCTWECTACLKKCKLISSSNWQVFLFWVCVAMSSFCGRYTEPWVTLSLYPQMGQEPGMEQMVWETLQDTTVLREGRPSAGGIHEVVFFLLKLRIQIRCGDCRSAVSSDASVTLWMDYTTAGRADCQIQPSSHPTSPSAPM